MLLNAFAMNPGSANLQPRMDSMSGTSATQDSVQFALLLQTVD